MSENLKIYTKTGDKGETSLLGGTRVPKYHDRIEVYGTIDELNSFIGLIRDQDIDHNTAEVLLEIQDRLFTAESLIAADPDISPKTALPQLFEEDVVLLEKEIDKMNETLPELTSFILPGGHPVSSLAQVARCVCRRAERLTIKLDREKTVDPIVIRYLNRLSDYLFVLARKIIYDSNGFETPWNARS
ncbi:MAG: cob(I)yrinic acid a,c-diamide adenosyltransferase [Bacteroidales bacterium]|nr:cob(I)yrinic acid a,c-diamide adenosyltransferase [Bacteroidales bacterium]MDZ4203495.1 cob(I)yrinic acid a,c-diamide adenosyltransferase [Bacteroidales bacterium]